MKVQAWVAAGWLLLAGVGLAEAQGPGGPGGPGAAPGGPGSEPAAVPAETAMPGGEAAATVPADAGQAQASAPATEGLAPGSRDPFWPVGYVPPKPEKHAAPGSSGSTPSEPEKPKKPAEWDQARAKLDLRGVSSLGRDKLTGKQKFVAMMTGKLVEEGDTVSMTFNGQLYRWKVMSIGADGVQLAKLDVRDE